MGLAAYGNNKNNYDMNKIIKFDEKKLYIINKKYIGMHKGGSADEISNSRVVIKKMYKEKIQELLGKQRKPGSKIKQSHMNIAKAVQVHFEKIALNCIKKNLFTT